MQTVTEGPRFVAAINLAGQLPLFLGPFQELGGTEPLRGLGRAAVDLPHHHVAIQMHLEAQFDEAGRSGPASRRTHRRGAAGWCH